MQGPSSNDNIKARYPPKTDMFDGEVAMRTISANIGGGCILEQKLDPACAVDGTSNGGGVRSGGLGKLDGARRGMSWSMGMFRAGLADGLTDVQGNVDGGYRRAAQEALANIRARRRLRCNQLFLLNHRRAAARVCSPPGSVARRIRNRDHAIFRHSHHRRHIHHIPIPAPPPPPPPVT